MGCKTCCNQSYCHLVASGEKVVLRLDLFCMQSTFIYRLWYGIGITLLFLWSDWHQTKFNQLKQLRTEQTADILKSVLLP